MTKIKGRSISSASMRILLSALAMIQVLPVFSHCPYCKNKPSVVAKKTVKAPLPKKASPHVRRAPAFRHKRFGWPLKRNAFWISSYFGRKARGRLHAGLDLAAMRGTPVYAAEAGTIETACNAGAYGNMILIRHNNNYKTRYAHLSRLARRRGAYVPKGAVIGYVGNSGRTRGRNGGHHLHFEVLHNGSPINPIRLLV